MLNRVILIGRLVRDPELRYTTSGRAVSNFTLAVERNYTNQQGERDVDFIKIVTWQKLAETCAHHLGKGRLVAVEGTLQIRKSQSEKDGRTYINPEVVASDVRFLDWPSDNQGGQGRQQTAADRNNSSANTNNNNNKNDNDNNNNNNNIDVDDDFDVPF